MHKFIKGHVGEDGFIEVLDRDPHFTAKGEHPKEPMVDQKAFDLHSEKGEKTEEAT